MTQLFVATAAEARVLRFMIEREMNRRGGPQFRKDADRAWDEKEDYFTPETWVAKPTESIEGISGDMPGEGQADIFKMDRRTGEIVPTTRDKMVYNLTATTVGTTNYVPITRTKDGRYLILNVGGTGAGTEIIRFKVAQVLTSDSAIVNITSRPCGTSQVSEEVGGQVTVFDPCHCWFNEPAADLLGRCGGASYMDPSGQVATGTGTFDTETASPDATCQWEVIYLCCPVC